MCAADFQDGGKFTSLGFKSTTQLGQGGQQLLNASIGGELDGGGVGVVGALRGVDVIVRMNHVVAALWQSQVLKGTIGDHLIGVHIRGRASAALNDVDHKLVVQLTGDQIVAGLGNGMGLGLINRAHLQIGLGGGLFDKGESADQFGHECHGVTGDGEVLHCACGMNAPVCVGRNGFDADEVVFLTHGCAFLLPDLIVYTRSKSRTW